MDQLTPFEFLIAGFASGVIATMLLDIWQLALLAMLKIPPSNWRLIGRWFSHMPKGVFVHKDINQATEHTNERALGWTMHYLIGVFYGLGYAVLCDTFRNGAPDLLLGLFLGTASVLLAWFCVQPGIGQGPFGKATSNPTRAFFNPLVAHVLYGFFLYVAYALSLSVV